MLLVKECKVGKRALHRLSLLAAHRRCWPASGSARIDLGGGPDSQRSLWKRRLPWRRWTSLLVTREKKNRPS